MDDKELKLKERRMVDENRHFQIIFENKNGNLSKVSIILLDWSCRESFHILHYLNDQTIQREKYEIIWIEYYGRRPTEIEAGLKECERLGKSPILLWINGSSWV